MFKEETGSLLSILLEKRRKYKVRSCKNMGLFWKNNEINKEEDGELENYSMKVRQSLAELECEEAIIEDKEEFGRARTNLMRVLRAKHGDDIANRALSRINKRIQSEYFLK